MVKGNNSFFPQKGVLGLCGKVVIVRELQGWSMLDGKSTSLVTVGVQLAALVISRIENVSQVRPKTLSHQCGNGNLTAVEKSRQSIVQTWTLQSVSLPPSLCEVWDSRFFPHQAQCLKNSCRTRTHAHTQKFSSSSMISHTTHFSGARTTSAVSWRLM